MVLAFMALLVFAVPQNAFAQVACPDVGGVPAAMQPITTSIKTALKTAAEEPIKAGNKATKKIIKKAYKRLQRRGGKAINGATTAAAKASQFKVKGFAKNLETKHTMETERERRFEQARIEHDKKVSKVACIQVTKGQSKDESVLLNKAVAQARSKIDFDKMDNVEGKSLTRQWAEEFQSYVKNFCNPESPNAPIGCGKGGGGKLVGADKDFSPLLKPITIPQGSEPAIEFLKESLNPTKSSKMALPAYSTASGQRGYIRNEIKKLKKMFVNTILNQMLADRTPTSNTGDQHLAEWYRILGDQAPQALLDYFENNKKDQVSEAEKRELERISSMAYQSLLDNRELSEGGASWAKVNLLKRVIEKEYRGLMVDERRNILLSLRYADMI